MKKTKTKKELKASTITNDEAINSLYREYGQKICDIFCEFAMEVKEFEKRIDKINMGVGILLFGVTRSIASKITYDPVLLLEDFINALKKTKEDKNERT